MIIKLIIVVVLYFITSYLMKFLKLNSIHRKIVLYFDYAFIYRPTLFFTVWVMICLGMYTAYLSNHQIPQWMFEFDFKTCLLFVSMTCIMGTIFIKENQEILNQYEYLDKNIVQLLSKISLFMGLVLLLLINIYNFLLGVALYVFWQFSYNRKIKNNLLIKCLSNTVIGILLLFSGFFVVVSRGNYFSLNLISISYVSWLILFLFSICYLTVFLFIEVSESGEDTFSDRRIVFLISTVLLILILMISIYIDEPLLSVCALVSTPFYLYALLRNMDKDMIRAIKYPVFIFNFFTATIFPYLGIAVIIVFYLSKYYYWHRFDTHYPTFLIDND